MLAVVLLLMMEVMRAGPRKPPHCGVSLMFESLRDPKNTVNTAVFGASQAKKHGIYEVL